MSDVRYEVADYIDALFSIQPGVLSYDDLLKLAAAARHEGVQLDTWLQWMARHPSFDEGECRKKWASLASDVPNPATGGSIIALARDRGWEPRRRREHPRYGRDASREIAAGAPAFEGLVEPRTAAGAPTGEPMTASPVPRVLDATDPGEWAHPWGVGLGLEGEDPARQQLAYINELFKPADNISLVTESFCRDGGKWSPADGGHRLTVARALRLLEGGHSLDEGGDPCDGPSWPPANGEAGAWVRLNPVGDKPSGKGGGYTDADVTEYRHALVECDGIPVEEQASKIRALRLPCAAIVESGNKSLHAVVRVGARDRAEYDERVRYLYDACEANGLPVDRSCKNPGRMTRLPGARRGPRVQRLVATDEGCRSWEEWAAFAAKGGNKKWPDAVCAADITGSNTPEPDPELVHGLLRVGCKAMITGAAKSGKSWAATALAWAFATGGEWLGFRCERARVLYVNTELKANDYAIRLEKVREAMGIAEECAAQIDVSNLRGYTAGIGSADALREGIVEEARGKGYAVIIIDPIYKVMAGYDENSAGDVGEVMNAIDAIILETGAAVIYVHHHAKGLAGSKSVIDRGSGSGVFARDYDLQIDIAELNTRDGEIAEFVPGGMRGVQVSFSCRGFATPEPINALFDFPIFRRSVAGILDECPVRGSAEDARRRGGQATRDAAGVAQGEKLDVLEDVLRSITEAGGTPTLDAVIDPLNAAFELRGLKTLQRDSLRRWFDKGKNEWCPYAQNREHGGAIERVEWLEDGTPGFLPYPWAS